MMICSMISRCSRQISSQKGILFQSFLVKNFLHATNLLQNFSTQKSFCMHQIPHKFNGNIAFCFLSIINQVNHETAKICLSCHKSTQHEHKNYFFKLKLQNPWKLGKVLFSQKSVILLNSSPSRCERSTLNQANSFWLLLIIPHSARKFAANSCVNFHLFSTQRRLKLLMIKISVNYLRLFCN